jgi:hypothetical protein
VSAALNTSTSAALDAVSTALNTPAAALNAETMHTAERNPTAGRTRIASCSRNSEHDGRNRE